jgi:asparagine synthetase B (glutamine-hydrolysing)
MHAFKYGEVDLYKNDTATAKIKRNIKRILHKEQAVPEHYFSNVLKQYICGTQLQQLLRYADRNAMAHSVETRLPYLSHELVEFSFSLPDHYKMENGWPKYLLRKAFDKQIPDKITWRKNKVGFETPENKFLQTEKAELKMRLSKEYLKDYGIENMAVDTNPWLLYIINSYLN